jgi:predicted 3-demethylubiquinone-9 3-methyltransferase (glyoxalase superfamily)
MIEKRAAETSKEHDLLLVRWRHEDGARFYAETFPDSSAGAVSYPTSNRGDLNHYPVRFSIHHQVMHSLWTGRQRRKIMLPVFGFIITRHTLVFAQVQCQNLHHWSPSLV